MNRLLEGKIAIVTGGNSGIGKAIAKKFAEQGATVLIFGTNQDRGEETVSEITSAFPAASVAFHLVDVSSKEQVTAAIKEILADHQRVDILVNNAGITRDQLLLKMGEEDWDRVLAVNVKSCYNLSQALVRAMMKARSGVIINMSSTVGLTGNIGQANYAASKAAVIGFTKALAKELAPRNIRVNCLAPGFIQTRMTDQLKDEQKKALQAAIPLDRFGQPEDIANAAIFLASDLSGYITGQVLTVDGGMVMG